MAVIRNITIFDLETSGLTPEKGAEIVEIAAQSFNGPDLLEHHSGIFHVILKPRQPEKATPEALEKIGKDLWEYALAHGVDQEVGIKSFLDFINKANIKGNNFTKPLLGGHNCINFDIPFIKYYIDKFNLVKDYNYPWFSALDSMTNSIMLFAGNPEVTSFSLDSCLSMLGLAREKMTHSAKEDIKLTSHLLIRQLQFFRKCQSKMRINNVQPKA